MPTTEIDIDEPLVRRLLATVHAPLRHLADGPITHVGQGWDNSVWRVGDPDEAEYAVRIPLRAAAAGIIETATTWLAEVAEPVRVRGMNVPMPVFQGIRRVELPWTWALLEWVPGQLLNCVPVPERTPAARALSRSLPALHRPALPEAPVNPARGVPLSGRRRVTESQEPAAREHLGHDVVDELLALIALAESAPPWPHPVVWCHGDLHVGNVVLAEDDAVGLIDFDDLTSGDPAVDLRVLWTAFDAEDREEAMSELEASGAYDPSIWVRARGWAASSFLFPVAANPKGSVDYEAAIRHTCEQLLG